MEKCLLSYTYILPENNYMLIDKGVYNFLYRRIDKDEEKKIIECIVDSVAEDKADAKNIELEIVEALNTRNFEVLLGYLALDEVGKNLGYTIKKDFNEILNEVQEDQIKISNVIDIIVDESL